MAPGGPPGASRGRGGKFRKYKRGGKSTRVSVFTYYLIESSGGKQFSKHLHPLDQDGNEFKEKNEVSTSSSEEVSEESEETSEVDTNEPANLSREERRAAAKAKKMAAIAKKTGRVVEAGDMPTSSDNESEDDPMPANPNHSKASRNQTKITSNDLEESTKSMKDLNVGGTGKERPKAELSRKEREAIQAQQAKERYQKLHEAGKTDEAKADLARLKLIREKREAEAARKQAEKQEREEIEKAKKAELNAREAKRREAALGPAKSKGKSKK